MKQYGVAIERWGWKHRQDVIEWLETNYGERSPTNKHWGIDQDYDLLNLYMDEDIYLMYSLRWP